MIIIKKSILAVCVLTLYWDEREHSVILYWLASSHFSSEHSNTITLAKWRNKEVARQQVSYNPNLYKNVHGKQCFILFYFLV